MQHRHIDVHASDWSVGQFCCLLPCCCEPEALVKDNEMSGKSDSNELHTHTDIFDINELFVSNLSSLSF